ncbi:alpha/beta hydrolase [Lacticaseibacillus zeae]|uniref:Alpha/beta hydrolase n=1 Tax=Lacticaseibacillus zeae TaxID=57037 RepID=A0A5R8LM07_LACZE|nr:MULTISPECIES: alpha/beta hydrolase [Lacticaseibacillus]KLI75178.1 alpha/beta hydrolase [Lacticaseibacillus casei]TLF38276.1 alpha/beta hydrolase [Lacticaseibacillus zeae]
MKRDKWLWLALLVVLLVAGAGWYWYNNQADTPPTKEETTIGRTATLYLHGYSGGAGSTNTLIRRAEGTGATKVLTATVAKNGKVHWTGDPHRVSKPIVQVIFQDNKNPDDVKLADWLTTINRQLYQRYGVRNVNFVAHSMGNMAVMFYAVRNQDQSKLPKMKHYVAIAGHFDGIIGMGDQPHQIKLAANGYPSPMDENYAELARLRDHFPKGVKVLNIYGDLHNGSDSDGRVSNNSSRSLRYLVSTRAATYQEREYFGRDAQHSALHENPQVAKAVDSFIW